MLQLRLLGGIGVDGDGREAFAVEAQPKRLAFLALLARAGSRGLSRDRLHALLWPESDATRARNALNQLVFALRRDLKRDDIVEGAQSLRLNSLAIRVDATAFEAAMASDQLERALDLYTGPFLDGFFVRDNPDFDWWVEDQRGRLRDLARQAATRLAERAQRAGQLQQAASWARRGLAVDPYDQPTLRRLLEILRDRGDAAEVIRSYEAFATRLWNDLGITPSAQVQEILEEVRSTEPARASAGSAPAPTPPDPILVESRAPVVTPAHPPAESGRRKALIPGLLLVLVIGSLAAWVLRSPRPIAGRILVLPVQYGGDTALAPVAAMTEEWLASGLAQTGLLEVVVAPNGGLTAAGGTAAAGSGRRMRASVALTGLVSRIGDSVRIEVTLHYPFQRRTPLAVAAAAPAQASETAIEGIRQRVMAQLAIREHRELSRWVDSASQPTLFAAYRAFLEGRELTMSANADHAIEGAQRMVEAWALDTTWTVPLVHAGLAYAEAGMLTEADSLLRQVAERPGLLPPFDRAVLNLVEAVTSGANYQAYVEARRLAALSPTPDWQLRLGQRAAWANRPREALDVLLSIPEASRGRLDQGNGFQPYAVTVAIVRHELGLHESELEGVREARRTTGDPANTLFSMELKALSGLGRLDEIRRLVDSALTGADTPDPQQPLSFTLRVVAEDLDAHDHGEAADDLRRRAKSVRRQGLARSLGGRAAEAYLDSRWDVAQSVYDSLSRQLPSGPVPSRSWFVAVGRTGVARARLGDRAGALEIATRLGGVGSPYTLGQAELWRARIMAQLGDRDEAVRLLRLALQRGVVVGSLHSDPDLLVLHHFGPYQALVRPTG